MPAAANRSTRKSGSTGAQRAARKPAVGTSDTTTGTGRSTRGRSTPVAIVPPEPTKPNEGTEPVYIPATGDLSVYNSVRADLDKLREVAPELANSALAATMLALAREMDDENSATSKSMCAKALLDIDTRLRMLSPSATQEDEVDELTARRSARLAGGTEA